MLLGASPVARYVEGGIPLKRRVGWTREVPLHALSLALSLCSVVGFTKPRLSKKDMVSGGTAFQAAGVQATKMSLGLRPRILQCRIDRALSLYTPLRTVPHSICPSRVSMAVLPSGSSIHVPSSLARPQLKDEVGEPIVLVITVQLKARVMDECDSEEGTLWELLANKCCEMLGNGRQLAGVLV